MILLLLSSFLEKPLLLQRLYVEEYGLSDYSMKATSSPNVALLSLWTATWFGSLPFVLAAPLSKLSSLFVAQLVRLFHTDDLGYYASVIHP